MNPRRRGVVVSVMAAALPSRSFAQPPRVWRLGYIGVLTREEGASYFSASMEGLRALGYIEGKNLVVETRFAGADYARLPLYVRELVKLNVDVILASSTPAASAALGITKTIPIVVAVTADPVGTGLVKSLSRPGGNVTGTSSPNLDFTPKQVELLQRMIPKLSRLGVLWNPGNAANATLLEASRVSAQRAGIAPVAIAAATPSEIAAAFDARHKHRLDAIIVLPDGLFLQQRTQLIRLSHIHRTPAMYHLREYVEAGGLVSYGQDLHHNHRLAAGYVDRIFRGAKPDDLPMEQSSKFELLVNARTAKMLGLTIPRGVLLLADKVIE